MGTLGLAYVGSPRANSHGGVCPKGKFPICSVAVWEQQADWLILEFCTEQAICLFSLL